MDVTEQPGLMDETTGNDAAETPAIAPAPPAAEAKPKARSSSDMVMIKRTTLNYIVIAIAFFIVGVFMGAAGYERALQSNEAENQALVGQAVGTFAAQLGIVIRPTRDPNQRYTVTLGNNPSMGPDDAPVTIVEFSDFKCPYCGRFARETLNQIMTNYAGKVRFVYRNFPILSQTSLVAALATECAHEQGKFWDFHDALFEDQNDEGRDMFIQVAQTLQMNVTDFTACLDGGRYNSVINNNLSEGQNLGITGTPTFFINGLMLVGAQPYDVFANVINREIEIAEGLTPEANADPTVLPGPVSS
jgi:protein-disulfide isomerase